VVQTLTTDQRGRGLAVAYSGGSLGAVITPLVVTPIFLWWGWRGAFWFTGMIGLAWLAVWAMVSRRPDMRKRPAPTEAKSPGPRLGDAPLWAFMCLYALGALPLGFVLYSASLYLAHPLGCSQALIGKVLWIPPLGWEAGYFVWGWLGDRAARRGQPRTAALRRMLACCAAITLAFAAVPWLHNVAAVMLGMFLAMFAASGFIVLSVAYATDVYSADHAGLIAGAGAGSWSAMVAVTMPLFGHLFDVHRYSAAFWIAAAIPVAGYLGWLALSSRGGPSVER
jgi:ACS family hexuronate transporter-like MFS transporter